MIGIRSTTKALIGAGVLFTTALPASAQDLMSWIWGGGSTVGGSGREVVGFSRAHAPGQLIVSFGDRRLYYVTSPGNAISYPIAIPRDQSRWAGVMSVTQKRVNPSWTPTPTMRRENPKLPSYVPGGHPLNPLGVRALYLGTSMYRIHGTDAPWTIGQAVSKGCIRMYNQDVVDLYDRVRNGSRVTVTWNRFQTTAAYSGGDETERPRQRAHRSYKKRILAKRPLQRQAKIDSNDPGAAPVTATVTASAKKTKTAAAVE